MQGVNSDKFRKFGNSGGKEAPLECRDPMAIEEICPEKEMGCAKRRRCALLLPFSKRLADTKNMSAGQ